MRGKCDICGVKAARFFTKIEDKNKQPSDLSPKVVHAFLCPNCFNNLNSFDNISITVEIRKDSRPREIEFFLSTYGKKETIIIYLERLIYGVSWFEANGLDEWLLPDIALEDQKFWAIYSKFRVHEFIYKDQNTIDKLEKDVIDHLINEFQYSCVFNKKYKKKIRNIFMRYGEIYKNFPPFGYEVDEWVKIIDEIVESFSFPMNYKVLKTLFWPNIFSFWW